MQSLPSDSSWVMSQVWLLLLITTSWNLTLELILISIDMLSQRLGIGCGDWISFALGGGDPKACRTAVTSGTLQLPGLWCAGRSYGQSGVFSHFHQNKLQSNVNFFFLAVYFIQQVQLFTGFGWGKFSFLYGSLHGTMFWIVTKRVLITKGCFCYCWAGFAQAPQPFLLLTSPTSKEAGSAHTAGTTHSKSPKGCPTPCGIMVRMQREEGKGERWGKV